MPSFAEALQRAQHRLDIAGVAEAGLDARLLLQAACGLSRTDLFMAGATELTTEQLFLFEHLLARRERREPVGRILGQREFWGLPFRLGPATLEPRPDSETLIEQVLALRPERSAALRLADLGTGTGCLLAALLSEYPAAHGVAVDASAEAAEVARANFAALGLAARAAVAVGSWLDGVEGPFDVIISNPPYIVRAVLADLAPEVTDHDPLLALDGGADGLTAYRALIPQAADKLRAGGLLVLELGLGQATPVQALAEAAGLKHLETRRDLGGIARAAAFLKN